MARIRIDGECFAIEGTVLDTVLSIGRNPDSYLFISDGRPIPVDSEPSDDVEAIKVASGG
ncbi:MAG: hypothetical protein J5673_04885 [Candidatus Methanomethylophilaceae archaeon]|nr:hypothetical protein [Candidatus Methanomethylophilaceae archaeon]